MPWRTAVPRSTSRFSASAARSSEAIRSHAARSRGNRHAARRRTAAGAGPPDHLAARRPRPSSDRASRQVLAALTRQPASWRLYSRLRTALERARAPASARTAQGRLADRPHRGQQPVDRRVRARARSGRASSTRPDELARASSAAARRPSRSRSLAGTSGQFA